MISDNVIAAFIGAVGAISVNVIYNEYRLYKEKRLDFLKMQIGELLLPLFIRINELDSRMKFNEDFEGISWETITENEKEIQKIAIENLNLANSRLSSLLLSFINYKYLNDPDIGIRYVKSDVVNENYIELRQAIRDEYCHKVKEYQNMINKPWWKVWQR